MWPRWSHTSTALTKLRYINRKFKCTKVEQDALDKIKRIVVHDTLFNYPYFIEGFKIHTDASEFQLGAVICQKGKPIAFHGIRLTNAQQ